MGAGTKLGPVTGGERIEAMDIVRGFALLGIFLMNVEFFSRPLQDIGSEGINSTLLGLDYAADALVYFFVQSKFWTLFSMLFGMGFAVMIDRAQRAGRPFVLPYLRRSIALLGIGAIHACLVWAGDILVTYAAGALVLLLLRGLRHGILSLRRRGEPMVPMRAKKLAVLGGSLYAVPLLLLLVVGTLTSLKPPGHAAPSPERAAALAERAQATTTAIHAYSQGTYAEAVDQRVHDTLEQLAQLPAFLFLLIGIFLIGIAILRSGALSQPEVHGAALRRVRNWGLPIGFALGAISISLGTAAPMGSLRLSNAIQMVTYLASGLVLALAYGATMTLAAQGKAGPWLRRWLAPAGRMALSNYLVQSLIGTLLFYHYGLGLWGQVGRAGQVLLVFTVFGLQLLVSRWWLARFQFGPVEWLWRAITYWTLPPMRREPASSNPAAA